MDNYDRSVVLLTLDGGEGVVSYVTSHPENYIYDFQVYRSSPAMKVGSITQSGDFSGEEVTIDNLLSTLPVLSGLASNRPYSQVAVKIVELVSTLDGTVSSETILFRGYVYQCVAKPSQGVCSLVLKNNKYYTDTTAGVACTEQCAAPYFGDPVMCKKVVHSETNTVDSVDDYQLTVTDDLSDTTPFLFNSGFISYGAERVKIRYHESGKTFQMDKRLPSEWVGASVELFAGCDKLHATCVDIHDNEERFLGLGIAMVDYNPLYQET